MSRDDSEIRYQRLVRAVVNLADGPRMNGPKNLKDATGPGLEATARSVGAPMRKEESQGMETDGIPASGYFEEMLSAGGNLGLSRESEPDPRHRLPPPPSRAWPSARL